VNAPPLLVGDDDGQNDELGRSGSEDRFLRERRTRDGERRTENGERRTKNDEPRPVSFAVLRSRFVVQRPASWIGRLSCKNSRRLRSKDRTTKEPFFMQTRIGLALAALWAAG